MMIEIENFRKKICQYKNILILTHDNPDPDAICSGLMFQNICKYFGVRSVLSYGGVLKRRENVQMVKKLKIDIVMIDHLDVDSFDGYALVDTQKNSGNNALPKNKIANFTIDHHISKGDSSEFKFIDENVGASATILMDYYEKLNLTVDEFLATAYCYSIQADTRDFSREYSDKDIEYYKKYIMKADLKTIAEIKYVKKPMELYDSLKIGLNSKKVHEGVLVTYLSEVPMVDFIPEIADILFGIEGVHTVLTVGKLEGSRVFNMSARTEKEDVNLSIIMSELSTKYDGSGGGHKQMAAGKFFGDHNLLMKDFLERF